MSEHALRQSLIAAAREVSAAKLSQGTSGNLSCRLGEAFIITPTGIPSEDLAPEKLVKLSVADGRYAGSYRPSSEWRFHRAIYRSRSEIGAIAHVHSPYATALACAHRPIPAFHYMVAVAGGDSIPCAPYASFGTEALADRVVATLADRTACLLANHGLIAIGGDLHAALGLAFCVEELACHYHLSLQIGGPKLLSQEQMDEVRERFKTYGQQFPEDDRDRDR